MKELNERLINSLSLDQDTNSSIEILKNSLSSEWDTDLLMNALYSYKEEDRPVFLKRLGIDHIKEVIKNGYELARVLSVLSKKVCDHFLHGLGRDYVEE